MVMSNLHYLDKPSKYDHIHFPLQYSHSNLVLSIENSSFQIFQDSQEDCFGFHDPIIEWLEKSYLASSIVNNRFWNFLMLSKEYNADEGTFARIL